MTGSHLCAEDYCLRSRQAARHPQMIDRSKSYIGFRCVTRLEQTPGPARDTGPMTSDLRQGACDTGTPRQGL